MSNQQNFTWQQKRKAAGLRFRYYARQIFKRTIDRYTFFILLLSLGLFFLSLNNSRTHAFQITGIVLEEVTLPNGITRLSVVPTTSVEIGGFQTFTDLEGRYTLRFSSSVTEKIPIIYRTGSREEIERVDFGLLQRELEKDYIFR